jgi:hypothetical protein
MFHKFSQGLYTNDITVTNWQEALYIMFPLQFKE